MYKDSNTDILSKRYG